MVGGERERERNGSYTLRAAVSLTGFKDGETKRKASGFINYITAPRVQDPILAPVKQEELPGYLQQRTVMRYFLHNESVI